jgi:hypothetical protein
MDIGRLVFRRCEGYERRAHRAMEKQAHTTNSFRDIDDVPEKNGRITPQEIRRPQRRPPDFTV